MRGRAATCLTLLIQQVQDAKLGLNEVNAWLVIIKVYEGPGDPFFYVLLLLQLEDMLQEGRG